MTLTCAVDKCGYIVPADGFGNFSLAEDKAIHQDLAGWLPRLPTLVDTMADNLPFRFVEALAVFPALELCF